MGYPDTLLKIDLPDPSFGGAPANVLDAAARAYIDAVQQFLGAAYLQYQRVAYNTVVAISQTAAVVGEVAMLAPDQFVAANGYYVGGASHTGTSTPTLMVGVFLEPCSASAKARIAIGGIVPAAVTGVGAGTVDSTNGRPLSINTSNGKLHDAGVGEPVVAMADAQGNALLLSPGRLL